MRPIARLVRVALAAAIFVAGSVASTVATARVISVGSHRLLKLPSQAAALARDGDRIIIDPGVYRDCAIWYASHLTIEARGSPVVIGGRTCAERGIFIIGGQDTTIRGLTFAQARGLYHNAAGILVVGDTLTVEDSRFVDNENGILTGGSANSVVRVVNSEFLGNGSCEGACAHGIYVGAAVSLLDIEHCRFRDTKVAHHIKSRARTTIIADSEIADGETGTSSYLIDVPNGGTVTITDNTLQKGAGSSNLSTVISIGEEKDKNPPGVLIVRDNRFTSDLPAPVVFVRNSTWGPAELSGNRLEGKVIPLKGAGTVDGVALDGKE